MPRHGYIRNTARITVERVRHDGAESFTARMHPEHGHASSGMSFRKDRHGRSGQSGRTLARWIAQLRDGNADGTVIIEDDP